MDSFAGEMEEGYKNKFQYRKLAEVLMGGSANGGGKSIEGSEVLIFINIFWIIKKTMT